MRFFRNGKPALRVMFDLVRDFHEDIRGTVIKLSNPNPSDEYQGEGKTYMEGFSIVQRGAVGDMTSAVLLEGKKKREKAFASFFENMVEDHSRADREKRR